MAIEDFMQRLVIWGTGELGGRVAQRWTAGPVVGITQSTKRHSTLQAMGVEARVGSAANILQSEDAFLLAIPGYAAQAEAIAQLQITKTGVPRRAVLISSTGYYGPNASGPISPGTPPGPEDRARGIAATEAAFRDWAGETGVAIRFGGLHRPGRGPITPLARRGSAPAGPPNKILCLIHYDDAATAVLAALTLKDVEPVYVGMTLPSPTRQDYYEAACDRLNLPAPSFTAPLNRPPHYDIAAFQRDLLAQPAHPDWREALLP